MSLKNLKDSVLVDAYSVNYDLGETPPPAIKFAAAIELKDSIPSRRQIRLGDIGCSLTVFDADNFQATSIHRIAFMAEDPHRSVGDHLIWNLVQPIGPIEGFGYITQGFFSRRAYDELEEMLLFTDTSNDSPD